jgi:hypothetical protein
MKMKTLVPTVKVDDFEVARAFQRVKLETNFPTNITRWKPRATKVAAHRSYFNLQPATVERG